MNYQRWKHLWEPAVRPPSMDWRHVCMVNAMLRHERPRTIAEIGCWRGFSSAAIIEAAETCPEIERADLIDCDPKPELLALNNPPRINAAGMNSNDYAGRPECWIIDGDHGVPGANADYTKARQSGARLIVIHDTHSFYCLGGHEGAKDIADKLMGEAAAFYLDNQKRDGEVTERGMVIGWFGAHESLACKTELDRIAGATFEELTA